MTTIRCGAVFVATTAAYRIFVSAYEVLPDSDFEAEDGKQKQGFGSRLSRDDSANESRNQVPRSGRQLFTPCSHVASTLLAQVDSIRRHMTTRHAMLGAKVLVTLIT